MSTLLRRFCTRIDAFYDAHPVLALVIAALVAACVLGIEGTGIVSSGINHIGGFA
jgi:hypothetical protein